MKYEIPIDVQVNFIREKLGTNKTWACNALKRIYSAQTLAEQAAGSVHMNNGVGFTPTDAKFLSSCAKQLLSRGWLTDKQMVYIFKKMPKYAGQLFHASYFDHDKMIALMKAE